MVLPDFPDFIAPYYELKSSNIQIFPQYTNRASSLGGTCERELVYARINWRDAQIHDVHLQTIFEEGELHERDVLTLLKKELGFIIVQQQKPLEWPEYQITGHIDALVLWEGGEYPLDIKSMSSHVFDSAFKRGPGVYWWEEVSEAFKQKFWLRKYLGQITLYCLMNSVDKGILLCKNKSTGAWAQVNVPLIYEYGEFLIQRAENINSHVAAGTLPDRIQYDDSVCPRCPFYGKCLPDCVGREPIAFLDAGEVKAMLDRRGILEEAGREFARLDKRCKDWAKSMKESKISIGSWLVTKNGNSQRQVVKIEHY